MAGALCSGCRGGLCYPVPSRFSGAFRCLASSDASISWPSMMSVGGRGTRALGSPEILSRVSPRRISAASFRYVSSPRVFIGEPCICGQWCCGCIYVRLCVEEHVSIVGKGC